MAQFTAAEWAKQLQQVKLAREHPVNRLALRFLPAGWDSPDHLPVVLLMLWALTETSAELELQSGWPYPENLESQVLSLYRGSPQWAMSLLLGRDASEGEDVLLERQIKQAASPLEAASMLLRSLQAQMRAVKA
jgi:hypothetical protein